MNLTHAQLVALASDWLWRRGCQVVITELTTSCGEIPDAIGWHTNGYATTSMLIECKTSRADYRADRQKIARLLPDRRMGRECLYLAPAGVLTADEVRAQGWGLLEAVPATRERWSVHGWSVRHTVGAIEGEANHAQETAFLISALRRVPGSIRGVRCRVYTLDSASEPRATLGVLAEDATDASEGAS